jgi:hypothetical protein
MKYNGNMKLGQWEKLFNMKKYTSVKSLEIFEDMEVTFSYFTIGEVFEYWKILGILKRMMQAWPLRPSGPWEHHRAQLILLTARGPLATFLPARAQPPHRPRP